MSNADSQAIVEAIDRRMKQVGNINTLYILYGSNVIMILLLALVVYFSFDRFDTTVNRLVAEVKLNTEDRTTTALLAQAFSSLEDRLTSFIDEQREQNQNQKEFNDKHMVVLDDAKTYINQNPIELLRQGK